MIIEISIAIITIAFVVLVIYLIAMINALHQTINQINQALPEFRKQFDEMSGQVKKTIEHTNQVTFDLKRKMESLDSTFNTISNLGEILEHKSFALKKESLASLHRETKHLDADSYLSEREVRFHEDITTADILELAIIGIRLWQKLKNKHSAVVKTKERRS
jgi:uncharacterized protein YoxC